MWSFLNNIFGGGSQSQDRADTMALAEEGGDYGKSLAESSATGKPVQNPEANDNQPALDSKGKGKGIGMLALSIYAGGAMGGEAAAGAGEGAAAAGEGAAAGGAAAGEAAAAAVPASGALELGAGGASGGLAAESAPVAGQSGLYELQGAGGTPTAPPGQATAAPQKGVDWLDYVNQALKSYGKNRLNQKTRGMAQGLYANW